MKLKTKCNIIKYSGIAVGTIAFKNAWDFYGSGVENEALIVSLLACAGVAVNFIAALITTSLESEAKHR